MRSILKEVLLKHLALLRKIREWIYDVLCCEFGAPRKRSLPIDLVAGYGLPTKQSRISDHYDMTNVSAPEKGIFEASVDVRSKQYHQIVRI